MQIKSIWPQNETIVRLQGLRISLRSQTISTIQSKENSFCPSPVKWSRFFIRSGKNEVIFYNVRSIESNGFYLRSVKSKGSDHIRYAKSNNIDNINDVCIRSRKLSSNIRFLHRMAGFFLHRYLKSINKAKFPLRWLFPFCTRSCTFM